MAFWPDSLPKRPLLARMQETLPDVLLRSSMDAGPAKVRRRFTAQVIPFKNLTMKLSEEQLTTFTNFYNNTLSGGALSFTLDNPRTDVNASFRFVGQPQITNLNGKFFTVNYELEQLP